MENIQITCTDCGRTFVWTQGEQQFYTKLGYPPPKHCPGCRAELKRKRREYEERREVQHER